MGARRRRMARVDATTSVGVVKKCSKNSVVNDSIARAANITTGGTWVGRAEPIAK